MESREAGVRAERKKVESWRQKANSCWRRPSTHTALPLTATKGPRVLGSHCSQHRCDNTAGSALAVRKEMQ